MKKKIVSLLLTIVFVLLSIPANVLLAFAEEAETNSTIMVESKYSSDNTCVDVNLTLSNNPGVAGAKIKIEFDNRLTLTNAISGEAFAVLDYTAPAYSNPCYFNWDSLDQVSVDDGIILTLSFNIADNIDPGENLAITCSYVDGDIYDTNLNDLGFDIVNGNITIIDYTPGDVNDDGAINGKDVTLIRRYNANYDVEINENAANVNGDYVINGKDVTLLRRYNAGYDVTLLPAPIKHNHTMQATAAVSPTCTEAGNIAYWYCTSCGKYFSNANGTTEILLADTVIDATGHTPVVDEAAEPTETSTGLTEGSHCSVCNTVLKKQEVIPTLQKNEYAITYYTFNNDSYLQSINIENNNPSVYTSEDGLKLSNLNVAGYIFDGWYDGAGANGELIKEIPKGTTGNIELYARWSLKEYTVQFDSPDVPVDPVTYTVDKGVTFKNADWYGYTFVGWSNDDGFIVKSIKPGTTGNMTLHANWTSNRNRATSYADYGDPIIVEDDKSGQFLFVYNIGKIENVPLSPIQYIGNTQQILIDQQYEVTNTISSDYAETIANMISEATTKSSGWTLSEDWNKLYEAGTEHDEQRGKTEQRTDSEGNVTGGNYYVSNSQGGSSFVSTNSGGSTSSSSKVTKDASVGINSNYQASTETDASVKLGVKNETELSAGVKYGPVSAGVKNTTTVSAETEVSRKDKENFELDTQRSFAVGTVDENHSNSYYDVTAEESSNWNTTTGYEKSYQQSRNTEVSNAVSELISQKYSYNMSESIGGENSTTQSVAGTSGRSDEYSSTLKYSEGNSSTTTQHIKFTSDRPGYYRLVNAGTVHVFAVVGYDIATKSYYSYTYNVLDDERHPYLDYSKDNANFNDCENGIVSFEVPYYVNEYIMGVTGRTEGLEFDEATGYITGYTGNADTVVIPQYYSADNGDGTYTAIKVRGFAADVFKGNTNIKKVVLPVYVSEIPENAFEGCTSLETIFASGVTSIGSNAFKGCISLATFTLDEYITSLDANAFEDVGELIVMANNSAVAEAVINSGAKRITLNISKLSDSFDDEIISVSERTEYFALISNGSTYNNLQINSNAGETFISNITLTENVDTPLKLNSAKVTLNRVTVENAPGFALILPAQNTELALYSTVSLSSVADNTFICKNISLSKSNPEVAGRLNVYGNVLHCGTIANSSLLTVTDGESILITQAEFEQYLTSSNVTFNVNGGEGLFAPKTVYYGQPYGELPLPVRNNYTFAGWFTSPNGGVKITSETVVSALVNQNLYAHWTPNEFTVIYNANGGTVNEASKVLVFGDSLGMLPIPSRDYYTFDGWFTKATGGEAVSADTVPDSSSDITIYAHWTQNTISSWVPANEVPSDAQVASEKWSYDLTTTKTSNSATAPSGYTQYKDPTWVWGSYGSWSSWSKTKATSSDSKQVETKTVTDRAGYTQYRYWIYRTSDGWGYGTQNYYTGSAHGSCTIYDEIYLSYALGCTDSRLGLYGYAQSNKMSCSGANQWFYGESSWVPAVTHTEYRYRNRSKVYTYYYKKVEPKESSTEVSASDTISNVKKWVQYRAK